MVTGNRIFDYTHLSLAQIHAALAYYYDHENSLDDEITIRLTAVDRLAAAAAESPLRKRLKMLGNQLAKDKCGIDLYHGWQREPTDI